MSFVLICYRLSVFSELNEGWLNDGRLILDHHNEDHAVNRIRIGMPWSLYVI